MANAKKYINAQLRRTLTKLGGNMQLDMIIGVDGKQRAFVKQAHIRPISPLVNYVPIADERIMDRPHQMNIKRFYEKTRSQFYSQIIDPKLASDWPMMISHAELPNLKYIKTFDDTYFAGCQRMSYKLYGCTHEILVPVWLDWARGIRFTIHIDNAGGTNDNPKKFILDISPEYLYGKNARGEWKINNTETFHNDFVQYILDYFDYVGISTGQPDVMNIDLKQNYATIRGLLVETGNTNIRQNFNIARNLIHRERPLLEANSLLINSLQDYKMIVTQLINFNICFNIHDLLKSTSIDVDAGFRSAARYKIWVTAEALHAKKDIALDYTIEPNWEDSSTFEWGERDCGEWGPTDKLHLVDFYTNHTYIPREFVEIDIASLTKPKYYDDNPVNKRLNALDYLSDYDCTDMMHQNKMTQPICHWVYSDHPTSEQLFNVYDGFGGYNNKGDSYDHGFGSSTDTGDDGFDDSLDNTLWAKKRLVGTGQAIATRLNQPKAFLAAGDFISASGFSNGIRFDYDPTKVKYPETGYRRAPRAVYLGEMTTPPDTHIGSVWSKQVTPINPAGFIGILVDRAAKDVVVNTLPKTQADQIEYNSNNDESDDPTRDIELDWHMYSDIDNRYAFHKDDMCAWYDPTGKYLTKGTYIWLPKNVDRKQIIENGFKNVYDNPTYRVSTQPITPSLLMRIGGTGVYDISGRKHDNVNALYVCLARTELEPRGNDEVVYHEQPDAPLFCMFFSGYSKANETTSDLVWRDLNPALSLGAITKALKNYYVKYGPMIEMIKLIAEKEGIDIDDMPLPDIDDFKVIEDIFTGIQAPEIIFFNNTVVPRQDITVSPRAKEFNYYKTTGANAWVWRYSGCIKPAMYPAKAIRLDDGQMRYNMQFGRNFLYIKDPIFPIAQSFPKDIGNYINKNIPPLYPSLDYDSVKPLIITDDYKSQLNHGLTVNCGDIMYDEAPPLYRGVTNRGNDKSNPWLDWGNLQTLADSNPDELRRLIKSGKIDPRHYNGETRYQPEDIVYWVFKNEYNTYEWAEYKWFNQSLACAMPIEILDPTTPSGHPEIQVGTNDKTTLEQAALEKICSTAKNYVPHIPTIDFAYLKNIYDIEYNLIEVVPTATKGLAVQILRDSRTDSVLYTYRYEIIATLK